MKKGKRYVESAKLVDRATLYDVDEAVSILKKTANAKFDETIEAHIRLGVVKLFVYLYLLKVTRLLKQRQQVQIS